jgi:hypothetical protein
MPKLEKTPKISDFVGNEERKQWIGSHPRITYLSLRYPMNCESGAGPLVGVGPATRYKRRCKLRAQFRFVALETSDATSGQYCWTHFSDQINNDGTGREKKAFERWASKHVPPWQDKWEQWAERALDEPEESK